MASFVPSKKTAQDFNDGQQYVNSNPIQGIEGDKLQAETINNLVESQLWIQALGTNKPDITYIADEGSAYFGIELLPDGTPRFKVANLKGQKGENGNNGIGVVSSGLFYLSVDELSGELYAEYNSDTAPEFELDDDGNLYYIIGD